MLPVMMVMRRGRGGTRRSRVGSGLDLRHAILLKSNSHGTGTKRVNGSRGEHGHDGGLIKRLKSSAGIRRQPEVADRTI